MEIIGPPSEVAVRTAAVIEELMPDEPLFLLNALRADGTSTSTDVARGVRALRSRSPHTAVIVLLDERSPSAVRAARISGAAGYLGPTTAANPEAVSWRISQARHDRARIDEARMARAATPPVLRGEFAREPGPATIARADLRDPSSGRLDARRIAARLGVAVSSLATAAGVTQQALSARPDSKRAQTGLLAIARVMASLDTAMLPQQAKMWLRAPHPRLNGIPPIDLLLSGRAEEVEAALRG